MAVADLEPTQLAAKAGIPIVKAVWGGAVKAKHAAEAHAEIGEVVSDALYLAICPDQRNDLAVQGAVATISGRLHSVEMPEPDPAEPGAMAKVKRTARRMRPLRRTPAVPAFSVDDFFEQLSRWASIALKDPDARGALKRVECAGVDNSPQSVVARFPGAFFKSLWKHRKGSRWRRALLRELKNADEDLEWGLKRLSWADGLLTTVGTASAGLATEAVVNASGASDPEALLAGGMAALTTAAVSLASSTLERRPEGVVDGSARRHAAQWITDYVQSVIGDEHDISRGSRAEEVAGLECSERSVVPSEGLVKHITRIQAAARTSGDERLATALVDVDVALARAEHMHSGRAEAMSALHALARLVEPPTSSAG